MTNMSFSSTALKIVVANSDGTVSQIQGYSPEEKSNFEICPTLNVPLGCRVDER